MFAILVLAFIAVGVLVFYTNKLKEENIKNTSLIEKNEEFIKENEKLKDELAHLNEGIESLYEILREYPDLDNEVLKKIQKSHERKNSINLYSSFLKRIGEELERKRRYEFLTFSVMDISIDFYDEYKELYGDKVKELDFNMKLKVAEFIRKIDFIASSTEEGRFLVLLPMTDLNGATVLGERIAGLTEGIFSEKIITVSVVICEVIYNDDINKIMREVKDLRLEAIKSGGNTIKVRKC